MKVLHTQVLGESQVHFDEVVHIDLREIESPAFSSVRIGRGRSSRTGTASQQVGGDDEEAVGVDGATRSDDVVPPPWAIRSRVETCCVGVSGESVTDVHRIVTSFIESAVGFVGDGDVIETATSDQMERVVRRGNRRVLGLDGPDSGAYGAGSVRWQTG